MNSEASFKVGDWLVEPELDRISQGPVTRNLRPKVMELLMYLANRPRQFGIPLYRRTP
jgi:DNA-binding winged helix-turn-helix (wHTH) protein